jgi:hypothetical protein
MATIGSDIFLHGRGYLEAALAALHASLHAFVSNRMRRAAAQAERSSTPAPSRSIAIG